MDCNHAPFGQPARGLAGVGTIHGTAKDMREINELSDVSAEQFRNEVLPGGRPVVMRRLVDRWPVVQAGRRSPDEFCRYIKQFDRGHDVNTAYGAPSIGGRLFYNDDLSGMNFRKGKASLSNSLDYLLQHKADKPAPTLAIQSVVTQQYLPGFDAANRLPVGMVPDGTGPRLWLGSRATIAAHYDPSENIACCVVGSRRFTLFPPEQVTNLYVGPFETTPAGATISMVDFDKPDYERFPRFREAEEAALAAVLKPGDAVYIPYLWWHHVRSLDDVNALVNYWWQDAVDPGIDPRNAMFHAMLAIRSLPASYRDGWRSLFEHYVFGGGAEVAEHLPPGRRGILGDLEPDEAKRLRVALSQALSRN